MFDLSLAEIILVVVVAVVFIGPKELPVVIKAVAKGLRGVRTLGGEIRSAFNELAKESGLEDLDAPTKMIRGDDGELYEAYDVNSAEHKK